MVAATTRIKVCSPAPRVEANSITPTMNNKASPRRRISSRPPWVAFSILLISRKSTIRLPARTKPSLFQKRAPRSQQSFDATMKRWSASEPGAAGPRRTADFCPRMLAPSPKKCRHPPTKKRKILPSAQVEPNSHRQTVFSALRACYHAPPSAAPRTGAHRVPYTGPQRHQSNPRATTRERIQA